MHIKTWKVNKNKFDIIHLLFLTIILLNTNFLLLLPLSSVMQSINSSTKKYLEVALCCLSVFISCPFVLKMLKRYGKLLVYIAISAFITLFISLMSMILYHETFIDVFTVCYYYLEFFYIFPILLIIGEDGNDRFVIKTIVYISIIYCIISCFQEFVYLHNGALILPGLTKDNYSFRNGFIRLSSYNVNQLAFLFLCSSFWNRKNKRIVIFLGICLELFSQMYVYQTRSLQILYVCILAFSFLFSRKSNKFLRIIVLILAAIISLRLFDINSFLETFSIYSYQGTGLSTLNRIGALSYYWHVFLRNPLFGNGFIRESRYDLQTILHGSSTTFNYSDVGIVGVIGKTGILGLIMYLPILLFMIKATVKLNKLNIVSDDKRLIVSLATIYLILTSFTLIACNPERMITLPILIALTYSYLLYNNKLRKNI